MTKRIFELWICRFIKYRILHKDYGFKTPSLLRIICCISWNNIIRDNSWLSKSTYCKCTTISCINTKSITKSKCTSILQIQWIARRKTEAIYIWVSCFCFHDITVHCCKYFYCCPICQILSFSCEEKIIGICQWCYYNWIYTKSISWAHCKCYVIILRIWETEIHLKNSKCSSTYIIVCSEKISNERINRVIDKSFYKIFTCVSNIVANSKWWYNFWTYINIFIIHHKNQIQIYWIFICPSWK